MLDGLKQALKSPMARVAPGIHICLDNLGVARNAGWIPKSSSQKVFRQFRDLAEGWLQTGRELTVQWIPGHAGIEGNELADQLAKKCAKVPLAAEHDQAQSLSNARRKLRKAKDDNWLLEWQKGSFPRAAQAYVELGLKPTSRAKSLPELRLKREVQGWLIAARQATDTSAHTTKGLGMIRRIRIAYAGRKGHSFTLLAAQRQLSTGRTNGAQSDKSNWHLRRC